MKFEFEYDAPHAERAVSDVLADLTCDTTHLQELALSFDSETMLFGDLEELNPNAFQCYNNILDEIYAHLEDNNIITENFVDNHPWDSDELCDEIDLQLELMLESIKNDELRKVS